MSAATRWLGNLHWCRPSSRRSFFTALFGLSPHANRCFGHWNQSFWKTLARDFLRTRKSLSLLISSFMCDAHKRCLATSSNLILSTNIELFLTFPAGLHTCVQINVRLLSHHTERLQAALSCFLLTLYSTVIFRSNLMSVHTCDSSLRCTVVVVVEPFPVMHHFCFPSCFQMVNMWLTPISHLCDVCLTWPYKCCCMGTRLL